MLTSSISKKAVCPTSKLYSIEKSVSKTPEDGAGSPYHRALLDSLLSMSNQAKNSMFGSLPKLILRELTANLSKDDLKKVHLIPVNGLSFLNIGSPLNKVLDDFLKIKVFIKDEDANVRKVVEESVSKAAGIYCKYTRNNLFDAKDYNKEAWKAMEDGDLPGEVLFPTFDSKTSPVSVWSKVNDELQTNLPKTPVPLYVKDALSFTTMLIMVERIKENLPFKKFIMPLARVEILKEDDPLRELIIQEFDKFVTMTLSSKSHTVEYSMAPISVLVKVCEQEGKDPSELLELSKELEN